MRILETERLHLRLTEMSDIQNMYELDSDPDVMKYINGGIPRTMEEIQANFTKFKDRILDHDRDYGCWMADLKENNENIGWFILKPIGDEVPGIEVGYRLKKKYWGKGLATEGSLEMIRHGFDDLGLHEIVAIVEPEHRASRHVLEKCGLVYQKLVDYQEKELCYYKIKEDAYRDSQG